MGWNGSGYHHQPTAFARLFVRFLEMSWDPHMEVQYINSNYPYNSAGSFMEYFEGLTYQHVNFIFDGATHVQESVYPSMTSSFYKFGLSDSGSISYYDHDTDPSYEVNNNELCIDEYRRASENSSSMSNQQTAAMYVERERNTNANSRENSVYCPRRQHNSHDYQVIWQDCVDPDNMTYEELLELGESVGTQSRGLSQELISLLPVSKYKCSLFSRKKSRNERWNIKEPRDGLPYLVNISTMLDVAPNGLASIRLALYVTQRCLAMNQNIKG
ncbi:hypothetical protein V6N11_002317 [Hibiscus sabdariffa]|uniref:Uncharacterized protein n=1 Tax=Hibiscus sabdariffa TaxID=183260 RepID=A0ABR2SA27_9ROSI